jgi:hypothetical protein
MGLGLWQHEENEKKQQQCTWIHLAHLASFVPKSCHHIMPFRIWF